MSKRNCAGGDCSIMSPGHLVLDMVAAWVVGLTVLAVEPDSGRKKSPAEMLLLTVRLLLSKSRQGILQGAVRLKV